MTSFLVISITRYRHKRNHYVEQYKNKRIPDSIHDRAQVPGFRVYVLGSGFRVQNLRCHAFMRGSVNAGRHEAENQAVEAFLKA
jgi:hypothetical protein